MSCFLSCFQSKVRAVSHPCYQESKQECRKRSQEVVLSLGTASELALTNTLEMKVCSEKQFAAGYNVLPIWKNGSMRRHSSPHRTPG